MFYIELPNSNFPIFFIGSDNKVNYNSDSIDDLYFYSKGRRIFFNLKYARFLIKNYRRMSYSGTYATLVDPNNLIIRYYKEK